MSRWPLGVRGGVHVPFTAAAVFAFCAAVVPWPAAGTVASSSAAIDVKMRFLIGHLPRRIRAKVQSNHVEVKDCGGHGQREGCVQKGQLHPLQRGEYALIGNWP